MAVTETTTESYGSRLGSSIKGVIGGLAVFLAGFPLLFWNEKRAVETARALDEGEGAVVAVESNAKVDSDNEGKLVHMTGKADTKDVLTDDEFGVSDTCISLRREVEIFQWVEEEKKTEKKNMGGSVSTTTTYTYKQKWCTSAVDSSGFKEPGHNNPPAGMEFQNASLYASDVSFGAFKLSENQIKMIGAAKTWAFPTNFTPKVERCQLAGGYIFVPNAETRKNPLNNRNVQSQTRPGDMRVTFKVVKPHDISIVARQHGESFVPWTSKKGNGRKINMLKDGIADSAEMFADARSQNSIFTWILRLVGFLLMSCGLKTVLKPISVLADVLPILGDLLEVGLGIVASIVAFVCAIGTIGVAWVFYRPVLGCVLLAVSGAGLFFLWSKRAAVKKAGAAVGAAAAADKSASEPTA